jgi:tetratricopeptide (TPR) repeat protein
VVRRASIAAIGVVGVLLGAVQLESMALYGDLARPPAIPAIVPADWGRLVAPAFRSPLVPAVVRAAFAQAVLHRGDAAGATAIVAGLPAGPQADDVRGQLAAVASRPAEAFAAFVRAGDFERAQALIDARNDPADAAGLERSLVAALDGPADVAVRARALWRLGQLTQRESLTRRGLGRRAQLEREALDDYDRALALAPNEETYLLAAGQQALTVGDRSRALRYYERAQSAVPDSADARAGLVRARS